jgi:hypothetical protein
VFLTEEHADILALAMIGISMSPEKVGCGHPVRLAR